MLKIFRKKNNGECAESDDTFVDDLPRSMTKNKKTMERIKNTDKRSKEVYDAIDKQIEQLKVLKDKIKARNGKKRRAAVSS